MTCLSSTIRDHERHKTMKIKTFLKHSFFAGVLALLFIAQPALSAEQTSEADAVYKNGFIYTADAIRLQAQAFAVRDGKFLKIGSNDDMKALTGKDTRVVDLKGKMVMPSLVDTHIHAMRVP